MKEKKCIQEYLIHSSSKEKRGKKWNEIVLDLVQIVDGIGSSKERLIVLKTTLTFELHKTHEFKGFCETFYFLL